LDKDGKIDAIADAKFVAVGRAVCVSCGFYGLYCAFIINIIILIYYYNIMIIVC